MKVTVANRQNLFDIALQVYGNAKSAFALALANGINITDELKAGTVLQIPTNEHTDTDILNFYTQNQIKPATGVPNIHERSGIGAMEIEQTFIVS